MSRRKETPPVRGGGYSTVGDAVAAALNAENGNGTGVIRIAPGTYAFDGEVPVKDAPAILLRGLPDASGEVLLTVTEDADGVRHRLFNIASSTMLFRDVVMTNCGFNIVSGENKGMVIYSISSTLDIRSCRFADNKNPTPFKSLVGGALYVVGGSLCLAKTAFTNNVVRIEEGNGAGDGHAGAIDASGATVQIDDCDFFSNGIVWNYWSAFGGACRFSGGNVKIANCRFKDNYIKNSHNDRTDKTCGGTDIKAGDSTTLVISDCLFEGGYLTGSKLLQESLGTVRGGSVWVAGSKSKAYIERSIFYACGTGDTSSYKWKGGSLTVSDGASLFLTNVLSTACGANHVSIYNGSLDAMNCTFANSDASAATPGAAVVINTGKVSVKNSILWNNAGGDFVNLDPTAETVPSVTAVFEGCITETDVPGENNKVGEDPLFSADGFYHTISRAGYYTGGWFTGGDWAYDATAAISPAVDGGVKTADFADEAQPNGLRANIGYDANTAVASKSVVDSEEPIITTGKVTVFAYPPTHIAGTDATVRGQLASNGSMTDRTKKVKIVVVWDTSDKGTAEMTNWAHRQDVGEFEEWCIFDVTIEGLQTTATYRFVALNADDTIADWSNVLSFDLANPPSYSDDVASSRVERRSAYITGTLTDNGGVDAHVSLKYWITDDGEESAGEAIPYNDGAAVVNGESVSFAVQGLLPGTNYTYKLIFRNTAGESVATGTFDTLSAETPIVRYVDTKDQGLADGKSWASAYGNLQTAITACSEVGDIIYVKSGEHTLGITTADSVNNYEIIQHDGLTIKGGYAGDGAPGAQEGETVFGRNVTIPESHRAFKVDNSILTLEDLTIKGFTVGDGVGNAIRAENSVITVKNCDFIENGHVNRGDPRGGVIHTTKGSLDIYGCDFKTKSVVSTGSGGSAQGGVLHLNSTTFTCAESTFIGNYIHGAYHGGSGGVLRLGGGSATISKCYFATNYFSISTGSNKNLDGGIIYAADLTRFMLDDVTIIGGGFCGIDKSASIRGGAIRLDGKSQKTIMNRVALSQLGIVENGHQYHRADIYISAGTLSVTNLLVGGVGAKNAIEVAGGTVTMANCTIADAKEGYGIVQNGGTISVTNSIVWGNALGTFGGSVTNATFGYCDLQDDAEGALTGAGIISETPYFADDLYYHLYSREGYYKGFFSGGEWTKERIRDYPAMSGAIDQGNPESDYSLEPQRNGKRINLGAYGGTDVASKTYRTPGLHIILR